MKLIIDREADRMTVAAILVKNGYRVSQSKAPKAPTSKQLVTCLDVDRPGEKGEQA